MICNVRSGMSKRVMMTIAPEYCCEHKLAQAVNPASTPLANTMFRMLSALLSMAFTHPLPLWPSLTMQAMARSFFKKQGTASSPLQSCTRSVVMETVGGGAFVGVSSVGVSSVGVSTGMLSRCCRSIFVAVCGTWMSVPPILLGHIRYRCGNGHETGHGPSLLGYSEHLQTGMFGIVFVH